uniref:Uncharacterized protein n=1 Tax=Zea mays TaxID=4577 RepID=C0PF21_MAIZE|nr:unknown [Zea mays]
MKKEEEAKGDQKSVQGLASLARPHYPSKPVRLQTASRTRDMSRPLSVRPAPSTTDARACRRARYTCGGTHPAPCPCLPSSPSRPSSWSSPPISISNSSDGSASGNAKRAGHAGTSTGADAAACRPGPSPNARLRPPCRGPRLPSAASTCLDAVARGLPGSLVAAAAAAEYQTSASARSGRSSKAAGAGATAPGDGPPRGKPRNRSAAANGDLLT